ncbi:uncharacterized protein LOC110858001 [Folsomia candida]|uniref:Putative glucosamine 6-phosphate N-acetyltransferase n=1 Tax=Folsomia candida TaxID=158441 RepID=A0A226DHL3_FOLCA|nr:uncharacterized protein LOC110858001 [Folsomia candida]OXA44091.1 putative glucosamine 6-phosphate N-acetyltransferase [Folsomia candida]
MENELLIEKATEDDIPILNEFINACYIGNDDNGPDTSSPEWTSVSKLIGGRRTTPEFLLKDMQNLDITIFKCTAKSDLQLVASCRAHNTDEDTIYSEMLCVSPTCQGKGVGKLMVAKVEELGRELKCKYHKIQVFSCRKGLIEWYEKLGFKENGKQIPLPGPTERAWFIKSDVTILIEMQKSL